MVRIALIALTAAWLVACDDGRTYYPIKFSYEPRCERINARGETHKQFAVALEPERYAAIPQRQDVMITQGLGGSSTTFSLTQDFHFECRVADQGDWRCTAPFEPGFNQEVYTMGDGELSHFERLPVGGGLPSAIEYTRWCHWKQVGWHNETSIKDDQPPASGEPSLPFVLFAATIYWLTGCML